MSRRAACADQDVFKTDPAQLVSVKAERTMVGGRAVDVRELITSSA
jgi:predicted amidohydrolase YtcJ